jgi:group I intron endonuclease
MPINVSDSLKKFIKLIDSNGFNPKYYLDSPTRKDVHNIFKLHKDMGGYYIWYNKVNNKYYVGSSIL